MKIACCQADVVFGNPEANLQAVLEVLQSAQRQEVDFVVFPEAFLTGYCVDSFEAGFEIAIERNHNSILEIQKACDQIGMFCVVGFAELSGKFLHNTAAFFEPNVPTRFYRKCHLPELGFDNYAVPGRELPVFETRLGKIGILICFDLRIPEAARVLALNGAQLIVLPTNWPEGAEVSADYNTITRAAENRVFLAACNRVGTESDFTFIGRSKIVGVSGKVLASAGNNAELIVAEVDLKEADSKRTVTIPGKYEIDVIGTRNPALYDVIVKQKMF